jgi:hypothetical protein
MLLSASNMTVQTSSSLTWLFMYPSKSSKSDLPGCLRGHPFTRLYNTCLTLTVPAAIPAAVGCLQESTIPPRRRPKCGVGTPPDESPSTPYRMAYGPHSGRSQPTLFNPCGSSLKSTSLQGFTRSSSTGPRHKMVSKVEFDLGEWLIAHRCDHLAMYDASRLLICQAYTIALLVSCLCRTLLAYTRDNLIMISTGCVLIACTYSSS